MISSLSRSRPGRVLAVCLLGLLPATMSVAQDVESQDQIAARIETANPEEQTFIKDRPILGWRLASADLTALPEVITSNLGSVDETGYDAAYMAENVGSVVALQMTGDGPDFYIIGLDTFTRSYSEVPLAEVGEKNTRLVERLAMVPDLEALYAEGAPDMVGLLKTTPVAMIAMSDVGYDTGAEVTIQAPWGTQTKPAGQDAFLVYDTGEEQYYMVNTDADGLPLTYIPAK